MQQLMDYAISRAGGSPWHLDHSNHWRGSLHHSCDSVPDTWRPHELLLQDWLKWHVNAKGRCDGDGFLCVPIVPRSWFTLPEVCRTGIVKCTVESSNCVHCGEISRLLCHYVVNTQFSLLIAKNSEIATLQRHIKGIGALNFRCEDLVYTDDLPMPPWDFVCKAEFLTSSKYRNLQVGRGGAQTTARTG